MSDTTDFFAACIYDDSRDDAQLLAKGAADRLNGEVLWSNHEDVRTPRIVIDLA